MRIPSEAFSAAITGALQPLFEGAGWRREGTRYYRQIDSTCCAATYAVIERADNPLHDFTLREPVTLRILDDHGEPPCCEWPHLDSLRLRFATVAELLGAIEFMPEVES